MGKKRIPITLYDAEIEAAKYLHEKYGKSIAELLRIGIRELYEHDKAHFPSPQLKKKK